jgi:hypothetical protein
MLLRKLVDWLVEKAKQRPHVHLDGYMLRFFLIPETRFGAVRVHKILKSDDDRAFHDHPFWFISIVLKGQYKEISPIFRDGIYEGVRIIYRKAGSIAFRRAADWHRIEVFPGETVWTLFICGTRKRTWGFLTSQKFKTRWDQYKHE